MKKISLMFFMLLISKSVYAGNFGISFISQSVDIENTTSGVITNSTDTGTGFGLYMDSYFKRKYRVNSSLSYITYDTFDVAQLMFSADYLMPVSSRISFFGGLAVGGALQTYSDSSFSDGALGAVYGAQLGAILFVNDSIMLELGYRLRPSSGLETEIVVDSSTTTVTDLSEGYFSILFMF